MVGILGGGVLVDLCSGQFSFVIPRMVVLRGATLRLGSFFLMSGELGLACDFIW